MSLLPFRLPTVANQDGAAILDVSRNQITTLNETGAFVWKGLQQGWTIEQVIERLATACNTTPANVEHGVNAFIEELKSEHLLCS